MRIANDWPVVNSSGVAPASGMVNARVATEVPLMTCDALVPTGMPSRSSSTVTVALGFGTRKHQIPALQVALVGRLTATVPGRVIARFFASAGASVQMTAPLPPGVTVTPEVAEAAVRTRLNAGVS